MIRGSTHHKWVSIQEGLNIQGLIWLTIELSGLLAREREQKKAAKGVFLGWTYLSLKSIVFSFQIEELLGARRCEGGDDLLYHHSGKPTDWVTVRMLHSKGDEISQRKAYK